MTNDHLSPFLLAKGDDSLIVAVATAARRERVESRHALLGRRQRSDRPRRHHEEGTDVRMSDRVFEINVLKK